jgi:hypothetical protein
MSAEQSTPGAPFRLADGVVMQAVAEDAVLMDMSREHAWSLNVTGAQFIKECLAGRPVADVVGEMAEQYGVEASLIESDMKELTDTLIESGLLVAT